MISRNKTIVIAGVCFLFSFLFYGLGFRVNYQPDIYGRVAATSKDLAGIIVNRDGRILNMLIMFALHRISFEFFYYASLVISMVLITISTYRFATFLVWTLERKQKNGFRTSHIILISIISCITIANMFSAEFFLYIDMTVAFTLAILLSVEASVRYNFALLERGAIRCYSALLFLLPVSFLYETISTLFIALTVPFIMYSAESFSDYLKKQIVAGVYYSLPLLIKTAFTRLYIVSDRGNFDQPSLLETVRAYTPNGDSPDIYIVERITFGMVGYVLLSLLVICMLVFFVIRSKRYIELIKGIYIAFVICLSGLVPYVLRLTNDYKPRIYYPLGAFIGVFVVYGFLIGGFDAFRIRKINILFSVITVFVGIQWLSFLQMYVDCYITNYEDKYISEMIGEVIDKYENETGNEVSKAVFYEDAHKTKYSNIGWCLTQRAFSGWTETQTLNYYLNTNFVTGEYKDSLAEQFSTKDWDTFSSDQIVIIGDTAHICGY